MKHTKPASRCVTAIALLMVGPVFAQTLDAPVHEVSSASARLTPDETQQRLHVLSVRDGFATGFKWSAAGVAVVGAFCVFSWVLAVTNTNFSVTPPYFFNVEHTPAERTGWLAASISSLAFSGLLAVASALIGEGVDTERADLERAHWQPKSDAEERQALGLTPETAR